MYFRGSFRLSVCRSAGRFVFLSVCRSFRPIARRDVGWPVYLSAYQRPLCICLSIFLSISFCSTDSLSVCPSVRLSVCLSVCLPVGQSIARYVGLLSDHFPNCWRARMPVLIAHQFLSTYLSNWLSACMSIASSIEPLVFLSIHLSVSVCLSACLTLRVCLTVWHINYWILGLRTLSFRNNCCFVFSISLEETLGTKMKPNVKRSKELTHITGKKWSRQ